MMGGGEIRTLETLPLDREVVRLSGKKHPSVLFVPTASDDAAGYVESIRRIYEHRLGGTVETLLLVRERPSALEIRRKIAAADVIYVGGGSTYRLMRRWKRAGVDRAIRRAYDRGALLTGMSAGGICWCDSGMSDSFEGRWTRVSGLGLLPLDHNPHASDRARKQAVGAFARKHRSSMFEIDNLAAVHFRDDSVRVLSVHPGRWARVLRYRAAGVRRIRLPERGTMQGLLSLL